MRTISPLPIANLAGALLLLFAPACDDDEVSPEPTVTLTLQIQSHGEDAFAPTWARAWPVWSIPYIQNVDLVLRDSALALEPVSGVRVALDRPDGTRLGEADSDADGLVVFEVPADLWPEGVAVSATAYREDYVMHTLAEIARPASGDPLALRIYPRWQGYSGEMVRVEGAALSRREDAYLYVGSTAPFSSWFQASSGTWALTTPAGVPFDVIAVEAIKSQQSNWDYDLRFYHAARISLDAVFDDTAVDIDLEAHAIATTQVAGSFPVPTRDGCALRLSLARPNLWAMAGESFWSGQVGNATSMRLDGDTLAFEGEVVETPEYGGNWYQIEINALPLAWSAAFGRGLPEGEQPRLLDAPEWVGASSGADGHPIDEPLTWEVFDDDVSTSVLITTGREVLWVVEVPEGATSATLPAPPSNVDLAALLGSTPQAMIALERQLDSETGVFWLESESAELRLDLGE